MKRLLELFCGHKSVGKVFESIGYEVTSLDHDPKFDATFTIDVTVWNYRMFPPRHFDVIWASPDCATWSFAYSGRHRSKEIIYGFTERAEMANKQIERLIEIIEYYSPKYWFIENPRGLLQYYPPMKEFVETQRADCMVVYYGNYNDYGYPKPTNIWSNAPLWHDEKFPLLDESTYVLKYHKHPTGARKYYKAWTTTTEERAKIPPDLISRLSRLVTSNGPDQISE